MKIICIQANFQQIIWITLHRKSTIRWIRLYQLCSSNGCFFANNYWHHVWKMYFSGLWINLWKSLFFSCRCGPASVSWATSGCGWTEQRWPLTCRSAPYRSSAAERYWRTTPAAWSPETAQRGKTSSVTVLLPNLTVCSQLAAGNTTFYSMTTLENLFFLAEDKNLS